MDLSAWIGKVHCGDCLEVLKQLPDGCAALAVVDGPYNMRKADWDKFPSWEAFREFYKPLWEQLDRVLRDNCSLYVFGTFEGLAALKQDLDGLGGGWAYASAVTLNKGPVWKQVSNQQARSWPACAEYLLMYARERVDISALAWDGVTREDNSIRAYLNAERERAGVTVREIAEAYQRVTGSRTVTGMAGHWFGCSQWAFPTAENYHWLRDLFNARGNGSGPYLRREYEDLRYTFNPERGVTDVWDVPICAGKERVKDADGNTAHAAQKPLEVIRRIIRASSNPGDVVIDPFGGSGTTAVAAVNEGRQFILIEQDAGYCDIARTRIATAQAERAAQLPLEDT